MERVVNCWKALPLIEISCIITTDKFMNKSIFDDVVHVFIYKVNRRFLAYESGKWRGWLAQWHLTLDHIDVKRHSLGFH